MNDTLLIAGGGQAGFSVASKLRKLGDDRPITIISVSYTHLTLPTKRIV